MPGTITRDQVEAILDALSELDVSFHDDAVRTHYSGKAMYGSACFGIVVEDHTADVSLGMALHMALAEDDADTAKSLARGVRTDNIASATIFYFPGWTIKEDAEEDQQERSGQQAE